MAAEEYPTASIVAPANVGFFAKTVLGKDSFPNCTKTAGFPFIKKLLTSELSNEIKMLFSIPKKIICKFVARKDEDENKYLFSSYPYVLVISATIYPFTTNLPAVVPERFVKL